MSTICQLHADLRYYLCMQPVDMRKQFQGLQGIINAEFGRYITQDEAFIFIGKTGTTAKILHREHGGLTLYSRLGACKVLGKDPEKWLAHTLKHIGSTNPENLHRLLPEMWTE